MQPPIRPDLPPPFHEIGEVAFENLCRDLFDKQPSIGTCDRFGSRGHTQYGIDLLAYRHDGDGNEVGQCKCCLNFTAAKIRNASKAFLDHEKYWKKWEVKRFILFVACGLSTTQHHDQIRKEKAKFKKRGIEYEVWSSPILRQKLRSERAIVANYCDPPEYWVKRICGHELPVYKHPTQSSSIIELLNAQIEQFSAAFSSSKAEELHQIRELHREGRARETAGRVKKLRRSPEWALLDKSIQADILTFQAGLVLYLKGELSEAKALVDQAQNLFPDKDLTVIKTLIRYHEEGAEAALTGIQKSGDIESFNLRAALLLELRKAPETIAFLKDLPPNITPNPETRRLLALAQLICGNIVQAQLEIQKALEERPRWFNVRVTSGVVNYYSAISQVALPVSLEVLPEPIEWVFINRDDESLTRLQNAEGIFRKLVKEAGDDPNAKRAFQAWRLACLANHPHMQREAEDYCGDLLKGGKAHPIVVIWSVARNFSQDVSEYKQIYENLVESGDPEPSHIVALLAIYMSSGSTDRALRLLERTKEMFSKVKADSLWSFWKAQIVLLEGNVKGALRIADKSNDAPFQRQIHVLALKNLESSSEEWQSSINALEADFEKSGEGDLLFRICEAKAKNNDWGFIATHADDLASSVATSEALRLAVIASFNTRRLNQCLRLMDNNRNLFFSKQLSSDLRRIRVRCQIQLGILPQALQEAEDIARDDPSEENLSTLLEVQFRHADRWGMVTTAQKLATCEEISTTILLRAARLIHFEHRELATRLWRNAVEHGVLDEDVTEANALGYTLGLDGEMSALAQRVVELAKRGTGHVQAVQIRELANWQRKWADETTRVERFYSSGTIPIHLLAEKLRIALVSVYHSDLKRHRASFQPLRQPIVFVRHGGRLLERDVFKDRDPSRLVIDITALLTCAHLEILDNVEKLLKKLYISPLLPSALMYQRDILMHNQPERIEACRNLLEGYNSKRIFLFTDSPPLDDKIEPLVGEMGPEWVRMLQEAKEQNGYIVDFLPLHTHDLKHEPLVLPEAYAERVINCRILVEALKTGGRFIENEYTNVLEMLGSEKNAPLAHKIPELGATLLLTGTIPIFLAKTGFLEKLYDHFRMYIQQSNLDLAKDEIENNLRNQSLINWLEKLIDRIRDGIDERKYELITVSSEIKGDSPVQDSKDGPDLHACTDLLQYVPEAGDIICFDDRFMTSYARREAGVPIVGINEILLLLKEQNELSEADYYAKILSLRAMNYRYVPIDADEILYHLRQAHVIDGQVEETENLEILRRYVSACLLNLGHLQMPPLPLNAPNPDGEVAFVVKTHRAIDDATIKLWEESENDEIAEAQSDWLFENLLVGVFGLRHLSKNLELRADGLELLGMDLAGLISQAIRLLTVYEDKEHQQRNRLNGFFRWLKSRLIEKRFRADPNLPKTVASFLKHLFQSMGPEKDFGEQEHATRLVLSRFYEQLPQLIKDELSADADFMARIGFKTWHAISVGNWSFEPNDFYCSLANVVNGDSGKVKEISSGEQITIGPIEQVPSTDASVLLTNERTKKERKAKFELLQLLERDHGVREAFLRDHRSWFDCKQELFQDAIAKIISTENPWLRVKRTREWHTTSASSYYHELSSKLKERRGLEWQNLLPPSGEGLARHLRLPSVYDSNHSFQGVLQESTACLLKEEGLEPTIDRLSGLPVRFPESIFAEASDLSVSEKVDLLDSLKSYLLSPISKIHLFDLSINLTDGNDAFLDLALTIKNELFDDDRGISSFEAFSAILQWVHDEFYLWPDAKTWAPSTRLALTWFHANRLYNLLAKEDAPVEWIINQFGSGGRLVTSEVFNRDQDLWNDVTHPRRVKRVTLLLQGLAVALSGSNQDTIDKLALKESARALVIKKIDGQNYPAPELLQDISFAGNVLGSYMGIPYDALEPLLGNDMVEPFSLSKLYELAERALLHLEKNAAQGDLWSVLYAVIADLPAKESLQAKIKVALEGVDLIFLKENDPSSIRMVLLAASYLVSTLQDSALLSKIKNELIRLAVANSSEDQNQDPKSQDEIMSSDDGLPNLKWMMLEGALAVSIVPGNPDKSSKNFADLMTRLIVIWPALGIWSRPAIFRLTTELPAQQSKNLWNLLLTARAV